MGIASCCYHPLTKLWEGYVFTTVCDSVHIPWTDTPLPSACWDTHPPPNACWDTPPAQCMLGYSPPGIRSTSGRYASHWNAFLYSHYKCNIFSDREKPMWSVCFVFAINIFTLQLWLGCGRHGELVTFDAETLRKKHSIFVETRGISKMTQIQDKVLSAEEKIS